VRPLCLVRSLPAGSGSPDRVSTRLQSACAFASAPFPTGTAPAFGRALAPCDGSGLLPLRLLLYLQLGDAFFAPPQVRNVYELCQTRSFPTTMFPLRTRSGLRDRVFWRGGPAGKRLRVLVLP